MGSPSYLQRRIGVLTRRLMRARAARTQRTFARRLDTVVARRPDTPRELEASVYSYCGEASFLDQVVSLRSFLRNIGAPKKFVIVSDGTLGAKHKDLLVANHPCVECRELSELGVEIPLAVAALVETKMAGFYLARKLQMLVAISGGPDPVIYTDSDVLYFPAPDISPLTNFSGELWFLLDCLWSLDPRLLAPQASEAVPVNSGFCLFGRAPDWEAALEPLRTFEGVPQHLSEQTIVHNMMHLHGSRQLPTDRFILSLEDRYILSDIALRGPAVMRHYVGTLRYKMWIHAPAFYS